jgi:hypothetical protein
MLVKPQVRRIAKLLSLDYTVKNADYTDLISYLKKKNLFEL